MKCFGSGSGLDRQTKIVLPLPQKGKGRNFMFEEFSVGLNASPGA
jgi:hypothetical protein